MKNIIESKCTGKQKIKAGNQIQNNIIPNDKNSNESIVYINARSVKHNLNKIEIMSRALKPKIICCTEARVTEDITDEIELNGFTSVICLSNSRSTGGVVMYIRKDIKFKTIYTNAIEKCLWCLTIEIIDGNLKGVFCCFYRANNANTEQFDNALEECLAHSVKQNKLMICMGDLNLNQNEQTNRVTLFKNACKRYDLEYISDFFTRITHDFN